MSEMWQWNRGQGTVPKRPRSMDPPMQFANMQWEHPCRRLSSKLLCRRRQVQDSSQHTTCSVVLCICWSSSRFGTPKCWEQNGRKDLFQQWNCPISICRNEGEGNHLWWPHFANLDWCRSRCGRLGERRLADWRQPPRDMGALGWACWKRTARIFEAFQVEASHDKEESSRTGSDQKTRMATDWKEASDQQENHLAHWWRQGVPTSDSWGDSLPCGP